MANEERVRQNFMNGFVDVALTNVGTTLTSSALAFFPAVDSKKHAAVTLDPRQQFGTAEIVWITSHVAGEITATILRAQEGTVARAHQMNTRWAHAPTKNDYKSYATRMYARSMWR